VERLKAEVEPLWQGLASVAIPGLVINRIVWGVGKLPLPGKARAVAPTIIGTRPSFSLLSLQVLAGPLALS